MSIVMQINPFEYFADTNGDALDAGYIWIGEIYKDPRLYPVAAYYDAALTIPAQMPLRTSAGYIVRNGSPTFLYINGNYSIRVEDSRRRQIFYVPDFLMIGNGQAVNSGDLANSSDGTKGSALVGFLQSGAGAVGRTAQSKMREMVSTVDFGAKCDALTVGTDDTVATKAAIAEIFSRGGGDVFIPGISIISESIYVPPGVTLRSIGKGYEKKPVGGFLFKGTGAKSYSIGNATAISIANPDVGAPYLADSLTRGNAYSTLDLSLPFSAGVILDKGARLLDMGVVPWFEGVSGYDGSSGNLSDDWDVGIWARNASGWQTQNVIADGHWRKTALLVSSSDIGDGQTPQCELGQALYCAFGGFRGVAIRAPRNALGSSNFGFAGTDFINCFIRSLNHQSLHLATSSFITTPFPAPSAALEMDGNEVLRGVQFLNCTLMGRDDISVISDYCSEILFDGCYEESKSIKVSGSFLANSLGSRMVATANTVGIRFFGNSKYAVDFTPLQSRDSSLTGQRYTQPGVFNPQTGFDDDYSMRLFNGYVGYRLRTDSDRYIIADYLDQTIASFDLAGLASKFTYSESVATVADDGVLSVPTPRNGGFAKILCLGGTLVNGAFPLVSASGEVIYDTGTTVSCQLLAGGGQFAAVAGNVTGTTGVDGNVTIGVIAGNLRIENRSGAATRFRVTFVG